MEIQIGQWYRLNDEILATIVSIPIIDGIEYVVYTYLNYYNNVDSRIIEYSAFKENYTSKLFLIN